MLSVYGQSAMPLQCADMQGPQGASNQMPQQASEAIQGALTAIMKAMTVILKQLQSMSQQGGGAQQMPSGGAPMPGQQPMMPMMPGQQPMMPFMPMQPGQRPPIYGQPAMPGQQTMPGRVNGGAPTGGVNAPQGKPQFASSEKDTSVKPSADEKRPVGDTRTAEQIVNDNPVLKNLGNQKDIKRAELKKQCGDWENEPDPQKRADAAYRVAHVLNYIDCTKTADGKVRANTGDGDIQGITKDGDARHGTEAGMLKDFAEQGYGHLPDPEKANLDHTTDTHVNADGSNQDELEWIVKHPGEAIGKGLKTAGTWIKDNIGGALKHIPVIGSILSIPIDVVGSAAQGLGGATQVLSTGGSIGDAFGELGKGAQGMVHGVLGNMSTAIGQAGQIADKVLGKIPGIGELAHLGNLATTFVSGGLNVADTAVMGGDVGQSAKNWGINMAGAATETVVGLVDPTGIAAGAAGQLVSDGLRAADGQKPFNAGQSLLDSVNPFAGMF